VKGIVFNLLQQLVVRDHGEDAWDDLLEDAQVGGAYTSLGSYDDAELQALAVAAAARLDMTPDEVVRWFGRNALPVFAQSYPDLFAVHSSARTFVLTLNEIIHPEVRKLYPGADVPVFAFESEPGGPLRMGYQSPRRMCSFAEGLIEGAATHYGEHAAVQQPHCMKRGDERCVIEIDFTPARGGV
jgi:Haem-NO-binding